MSTLKRTLTARLDAQDVAEVEKIAWLDGSSLAEIVREGIQLVMEQRRSDPAFLERAKAALAGGQQALDELAMAGPLSIDRSDRKAE